MHTAKELHDWLEASNLFEPDARQIILRALSLLASVEDEDGIVRELTAHPKGTVTADFSDHRDPLRLKAAALIVAQRQEINSLERSHDAIMQAVDECGSYKP